MNRDGRYTSRGKSKGGKKKPKKGDARVDMTPMVDLMSLLITFFMLTAAFSKPKVMEIVLPEKLKKDETVELRRSLKAVLSTSSSVPRTRSTGTPARPTRM
ncbi:MAG: biopolymer transporter ExbD [Bacteroidales bacterium]